MNLEMDERGDGCVCVLERKPRKEFLRDKRRPGEDEEALPRHSGKNDYTKLEKLWYSGEKKRVREKERKKGEEGENVCSEDIGVFFFSVTILLSFIANISHETSCLISFYKLFQ